jgi:hypothetical protein
MGPLQIDSVFNNFAVSPGQQERLEVECPAGEHVTGGGVRVASGDYRQAEINSSYPGSIPGNPHASWVGYVDHLGGTSSITFQVVALCVESTAVEGNG